MLAPVIGSPASSSQNMIWRYSSSATVACSRHRGRSSDRLPGRRRAAALGEGRDDRLIEAVAHRPLGHGDVREPRSASRSAASRSRAVGDAEEAADRGGGLEVLDRVADRDAVLRARSRGRAGGTATALRLARSAGYEVVGVGGLDPLHRPPIAPLSRKRRSSWPCSAEQLVRLRDVDLAAEQKREHAARVPRRVPLEPAREALEQQVRDPGVDHPLGRRAVLAGRQSPVR